MTFFRCGGSEEKILSFTLSAANGTQGTFRNGRYFGPIVSKNQSYVPVQKDGSSIVYTLGATRVIHIRFRINSGTGYRVISGVRYGATYWPSMGYTVLQDQSNETFFQASFSSNGTSVAKTLTIPKTDIPFVSGDLTHWYDVEFGWDKDTKEIYLEISDTNGHHKKVTDTLDTIFQYSTDYEYVIGTMNSDDRYASGITFDLWNTWYEENHSRIVWGIKGG